MANGSSDFYTAFSAASGLHTRAKLSLVQQAKRSFTVKYTGLGNEDIGDRVILFGPLAPNAQFIPELLRIRHNGTGNFSMPLRFAKLTTQDGVRGESLWDVTWSRSSTTCTVTTPVPHGLSNNQVLNVSVTSSAAAVPLGTTGIIVVTGPTTFTFTCPNAGDATGTATIGEYASDIRQATWSRTTTTLTVTTQGAHGLESNQKVNLLSISDAAVISTGAVAVTVTGATTFTVTCNNAGGSSGTATLKRDAGNWTPITSEASYTQAAIYTGAGVATVSNGPLGLGESPLFRKSDQLVIIWGSVSTAIPTTRVLTIEGTFRQIS